MQIQISARRTTNLKKSRERNLIRLLLLLLRSSSTIENHWIPRSLPNGWPLGFMSLCESIPKGSRWPHQPPAPVGWTTNRRAQWPYDNNGRLHKTHTYTNNDSLTEIMAVLRRLSQVRLLWPGIGHTHKQAFCWILHLALSTVLFVVANYDLNCRRVLASLSIYFCTYPLHSFPLFIKWLLWTYVVLSERIRLKPVHQFGRTYRPECARTSQERGQPKPFASL